MGVERKLRPADSRNIILASRILFYSQQHPFCFFIIDYILSLNPQSSPVRPICTLMSSQPLPLTIQRVDSESVDPFSPAHVYYGTTKDSSRIHGHVYRTHTSVFDQFKHSAILTDRIQLHEPSNLPAFRRFSLGWWAYPPLRQCC